MLWLYARQPATVLNRLNARQSENFTEFSLKVFGVSLEMSSNSKNYFGFTFDDFTELVLLNYRHLTHL